MKKGKPVSIYVLKGNITAVKSSGKSNIKGTVSKKEWFYDPS